jgi:hypothetical protein
MPAPAPISVPTDAPTREAPWTAGLRGARANLIPGLVLQSFALTLVLAYFWHTPTHDALNRLSAWRSELGLTFAIVSTGLFGGLLPFLYLRFTAARYTWPQGALLTAFWAYKGIEIDLWYRVLAHLVGEGHAPATVATKMLLDQFLYCPLIAIPLTTLAYTYAETHFNARAVLADLRAPRPAPPHLQPRRLGPRRLHHLRVADPASTPPPKHRPLLLHPAPRASRAAETREPSVTGAGCA